MGKVEAEDHISKYIKISRSLGLSDDDMLEHIIDKINPKNRYLIFACDKHYPSGGFEDFITSTSTFEEAELIAARLKKRFCSNCGRSVFR